MPAEERHGSVKLWLDDIRPAPIGWTWVTHASSALEALLTGNVLEASLDHDLGWCERCGQLARMEGSTILRSAIVDKCTHVPQGTDLARWIVEQKAWPKQRITIHSWNPEGTRRMAEILAVGPVPIVIRAFES